MSHMAADRFLIGALLSLFAIIGLNAKFVIGPLNADGSPGPSPAHLRPGHLHPAYDLASLSHRSIAFRASTPENVVAMPTEPMHGHETHGLSEAWNAPFDGSTLPLYVSVFDLELVVLIFVPPPTYRGPCERGFWRT